MKYTIVFSFLILLPITSIAQQNRWKVGVQGGLSQINYVIHSSRINFGIESNNDYVALGGVNVTYGLSHDFTLRTGLIYER